MADYKKDLAEKLERDAKKNAELEYESALLEEIAEKSEVDIPASLIDREVHDMIHEFEHRLSHQGMNLEDYLGYMGTTMADFKKAREEDAKKNVRTRLVVQKLISEHKLNATNEDIEAKLADYASQYNLKVEEVKNNLSQQDWMYFQNQALMEKVLSFIKEQNK